MNYRNATANTNFFLWRENREYCERKFVFSSILKERSMLLFFHLFSLQFDGRTTRSTRRFDDFFSDGYLPEFTKRQGFQFFLARKTGLFLLAKIKHHNWPPIFLLKEQGIVPRSEPMLLPQPKIWYKEKIIRTLKLVFEKVYGNFAIPLPTDYVQLIMKYFTCLRTHVCWLRLQRFWVQYIIVQAPNSSVAIR